MTDLQLLFLVLAALYLWECGCWVSRGSVAYRTRFGGQFHSVHPSRLLGNQRGGFVFAHPLPPLGTLFLTHQWPLSLSEQSVLAFVSPSMNPGSRPPQSGKFCTFAEIQTVKAQSKNLFINGKPFVCVASAGWANHVARLLQELTSLPSAKRGKAIELLLHQAWDRKAMEQRYGEFRDQTRFLRMLSNVLFGYLFVLAPAVIWRFGLGASWIGLLAGLLACTTTTAVQFRRLHRHFYPELEDERFTHFLIILLSPATTIRALDLLSRHLLETYHPLAVASLLCPPEEFRDLAAHYLRELSWPALPTCPRSEPVVIEAEQQTRLRLKREVENMLRKARLGPAELLRPPRRAESTCQSYCPRCLAQFMIPTGTCEDCGGIPLMAFGAGVEPPTA